MKRIGLVGARGYAGAELVKLLGAHPAMQPRASKACVSSSSLHSVFSGLRCTLVPYQVEPISTRRFALSTFI